MRHNRDEKRFDRTSSHLKSMLSNMTNDLIEHGRIKTTTPKAKVLRRHAEKMITLGKNGTVAARRRAMAFMKNKTTVTKLFDDLASRYKERNGGYTRILKLGIRPGDNAPMSIIELVEEAGAAVVEPKPKKKAPARKPAAKKAAPKKEAAEKAPAKKPAAKKAAAEKKEAAPKKAAAKKAPAKKKAEGETGTEK